MRQIHQGHPEVRFLCKLNRSGAGLWQVAEATCVFPGGPDSGDCTKPEVEVAVWTGITGN